MKRFDRTLAFAALCALPAVGVAAPASVEISQCWIRALPGNTPSAAYFTMRNPGDHVANLVGVQTAAFGMAMLHQTQNKGDMSSMIAVRQVSVPAHGTSAFAPGGYHVMLEKPEKPLSPGATISMTMKFAGGQSVTAPCEVKGAAATSY